MSTQNGLALCGAFRRNWTSWVCLPITAFIKGVYSALVLASTFAPDSSNTLVVAWLPMLQDKCNAVIPYSSRTETSAPLTWIKSRICSSEPCSATKWISLPLFAAENWYVLTSRLFAAKMSKMLVKAFWDLVGFWSKAKSWLSCKSIFALLC